MNEQFFKFPSTPHLALLGDVQVRDDKVLSELERTTFLQHKIVVEEKVDGANLGISFDSEGNIRAQNRGSYLQLPDFGQWKKLSNWLKLRKDNLFSHLTNHFILFGEWCYARHSVRYDQLPDWFLGHDILDKKSGNFFSIGRRNELLERLGIFPVPFLRRGRFSLSELQNLLSKSRLGNEAAEGLYLRFDQGKWLAQRAKLVRPAFTQSIGEHWSRGDIKTNRLHSDTKMRNPVFSCHPERREIFPGKPIN